MTRLFTTIALTLVMSLGLFAFIAYFERDGFPGRRVGGGTRYTELLKYEE